jgi:peptide/nickel transport system substrate-binding protein
MLLGTVLVSCAPAARPASGPVGGTATEAPASQRVLVVAVRGEPPSLASQPVAAFSGSLQRPRELFNAQLDYRDENEKPQAQLAQALPQLNTDSWRVLADGRMETTYHLRPNLTWHDGTPLSAEDLERIVNCT